MTPVDMRYTADCVDEPECPPCTAWIDPAEDTTIEEPCSKFAYYNHPFMQTVLMFFGEFLNYALWLY